SSHTLLATAPAPSVLSSFFPTRRSSDLVAVVVAGLTLLTLPATGLRLALPDAGALPQESSARQTYDLVSEHFGPGANGPLIVTRSEEHTSELQSRENLVCRLLLQKK